MTGKVSELSNDDNDSHIHSSEELIHEAKYAGKFNEERGHSIRPVVADENLTKQRKKITEINNPNLIEPLVDGNPNSKMTCLVSSIGAGVTLVGGPRAGIFTFRGRTSGINECINKCCLDNECDLAILVSGHCYTVKCFTPGLCKLVPRKRAGHYVMLVGYVKKTVTYSADSNGRVSSTINGNIMPQNIVVCQKSPVYEGFTLKGGYDAGHFSYRGEVRRIEDCVEYCCDSKFCDLVFMVTNQCYLVYCHSRAGCQRARAYAGMVFRTRMVYLHTREHIAPHLHSNDIGLRGKVPKSKYQAKATPLLMRHFSRYHMQKSTTAPRFNPPSNIKQAMNSSNTSNNSICMKTRIVFNMTLSRGFNSKKLIPHGLLPDSDCVEKCCRMKNCSIAFMLKDHCFSIICMTRMDCRPTQAKSSKYAPRMAFIRGYMSSRGKFSIFFGMLAPKMLAV